MVNDNKSLAEEPTVQRIETFLQAKEVAAKHRKTVLEIMDTLCHLLQSPSLRKPFCYSDDMITRVELVMACLLIHLHRKTLSLAKLSEAVRVMRTTVRPDKPGRGDKEYHRALAVFVEKTVPTLTFNGISRRLRKKIRRRLRKKVWRKEQEREKELDTIRINGVEKYAQSLVDKGILKPNDADVSFPSDLFSLADLSC